MGQDGKLDLVIGWYALGGAALLLLFGPGRHEGTVGAGAGVIGVVGLVLIWRGLWKAEVKRQQAEAQRQQAAAQRSADEARAVALRRAEEEAVLRRRAADENVGRSEPSITADLIRRGERRDADKQDKPFRYKCVGHPTRTLALRYGIAINPRLDFLALRKLGKITEDDEGTHYLAELPDFGNRKVRVVIQPGAEYIKTFYPMSKQWFDEHADLEMILKDNQTFDLKELATFHVQAVLNAKR